MDPEPPNLVYSTFQTASGLSVNEVIVLSIIFILLIIFTAFLKATEVSFLSLIPKDIKDIADNNPTLFKRVSLLTQKPLQLSATFLISATFLHITLIIIAERLLRIIIGENNLIFMGEWLYYSVFYGFLNPETWSFIVSLLLSISIITFFLVLFTIMLPRVYASLFKKWFIQWMSKPLSILNKLFSPFTRMMVGWSKAIETKISNNNNHSQTLKEDIDAAIDLTVTGSSESAHQEAGLIKAIISFGDTSAKQIMRPRMDIVGIDIDTSFKEVMQIVRESGYSRLPVYEEDLDKIKGILYVKDLLKIRESDDNFEWQTLIRNAAFFIPESKKIDELLKEFQSKRMHMAIIVDEYGGTAGIATLEDIMEEVVGDIRDEFDLEEEVEYIKIAENNYIFEAKTLLNDVCRIIGVNTGIFDELRGEADSLGGLILEITGHIPSSEQEIIIDNIVLKVISVTRRRIEKVSLIIHEK